MKKRFLYLSLIILTLVLGFSLSNDTFYNFVESKLFYSGEESVELTVGTYTSSDGHTITVGEDGVVKYDDTYTLTATASDRGYVISGKIGTNNKAVTFYQLNDSKLVSGGVVSYTHSGSTVYLYDYTVFSMDATPVVDENGVIEVYHEGTLVNKYSDLQSAVDSSVSGDTIKITSDMDVVGGAYITKNITIEGNNKTLNVATWANGVFVVEEGASLTINNLTIDGGSTGFEVDYESVTYTNYTIPLVNGSDTNDVKQNSPIVVSKGTLNIDNVNMNNYYTATAGGAIRVVSGSIDVKNSAFNHNRSSNGAAISVGSNFEADQNEYPVENVNISFSEFNRNYSGNGGAVYIYNAANVNINDTNFNSNTVTGGYGGAVMFNKQKTTAVSKGLDFIQAKIDNCEFVGNWAGNDGFAVQNYDAELTTTNSLFKKNVGVHPSSSVGTYSMQVSRTEWANESISNSVFEENFGAISGIADHGGHVFLNVDNCDFSKNIGSSTMYFLTSIITVSNCEFVDEVVTSGVIDASSYSGASEYIGTDYTGPRTTVKDCNFSNNGNIDILTRVRGADLKYDLVIQGEVNGNVQVWQGTNLIVEGVLNGDVITDRDTTSDNIKVSEDGKINGFVSHMSNHYRLSLRYNFGETEQIDGYDVARLFLEENRTYTDKELYMMHFLDKNGMKLEYYTDAGFTTLWNYVVTTDTTLYAKWVEHEHVYDQELVLHENAIYEQCSCGHLGKKLSLSIPTDLYYSGTKIETVIDNELSLEGYTVKYQAIDKDGVFVDIEGVPVKVGTYKAILTYGDMTITSEYSIVEKPVNPSTGIITPYIICGIVVIIGLVGTILYRKKKFM